MKTNNAKKVMVAGAAAAAVAAAGYFLLGPKGEKNRKKFNSVAKKYFSEKNKKEAESLVRDLKKHWDSIAGSKTSSKK